MRNSWNGWEGENGDVPTGLKTRENTLRVPYVK